MAISVLIVLGLVAPDRTARRVGVRCSSGAMPAARRIIGRRCLMRCGSLLANRRGSEVGDVVRLVDNAPGISIDGHDDMMAWAREWIDGFARGDYGKFRSMIVVVETADGQLGVISQSIANVNMAALVGLLTVAAHRKMDGGANIDDLRVDANG